MKAKMVHENFHVLDLEKSIAFYQEAFGLEVVDEISPEDGSWKIVYMGNDTTEFRLELTWNEGRTDPYETGGRDIHLAFVVEDIEEAHALHEKMGVIVHENMKMGVYFVSDPDGLFLEVMAEKNE